MTVKMTVKTTITMTLTRTLTFGYSITQSTSLSIAVNMFITMITVELSLSHGSVLYAANASPSTKHIVIFRKRETQNQSALATVRK